MRSFFFILSSFALLDLGRAYNCSLLSCPECLGGSGGPAHCQYCNHYCEKETADDSTACVYTEATQTCAGGGVRTGDGFHGTFTDMDGHNNTATTTVTCVDSGTVAEVVVSILLMFGVGLIMHGCKGSKARFCAVVTGKAAKSSEQDTEEGVDDAAYTSLNDAPDAGDTPGDEDAPGDAVDEATERDLLQPATGIVACAIDRPYKKTMTDRFLVTWLKLDLSDKDLARINFLKAVYGLIMLITNIASEQGPFAIAGWSKKIGTALWAFLALNLAGEAYLCHNSMWFPGMVLSDHAYTALHGRQLKRPHKEHRVAKGDLSCAELVVMVCLHFFSFMALMLSALLQFLRAILASYVFHFSKCVVTMQWLKLLFLFVFVSQGATCFLWLVIWLLSKCCCCFRDKVWCFTSKPRMHVYSLYFLIGNADAGNSETKKQLKKLPKWFKYGLAPLSVSLAIWQLVKLTSGPSSDDDSDDFLGPTPAPTPTGWLPPK